MTTFIAHNPRPASTQTHLRTSTPQQQPPPPPRAVNITDDYERWYTEGLPNNRMLLSLRSGIPEEIGWALDRLCRLCDNDQFSLKAIPGLTDALLEWPEWYAKEGYKQTSPIHSLFAVDKSLIRKRRNAQESFFILRNAALNEHNANALELAENKRTLPLLLATIHNVSPNLDHNVELLLNAIELLQTACSALYISPHSIPPSNPIPTLEEIVGTSPNRSLIITSLLTLTTIYSHPSHTAHLKPDSPAFRACLRYLPLFSDKGLIDACINYLCAVLSHAPLTRAFLLHPDMPAVLKILVSLVNYEQAEEIVLLDVTEPHTQVSSTAPLQRPHVVTQEELDSLIGIPEPQRCYDWMKTMFVAKPEGELTQVEFWNLYKDVFTPHQHQYPVLAATDVIKNVNFVFPQAQAMVLPGPPQRFVVRGVDRVMDDIELEKFKCRWDRSQCPTPQHSSPGELYDHILEHIAALEETDAACTWSSCDCVNMSKQILRKHVLTHLSPSQSPAKHPSQSETITVVPGVHTYPTPTPTARPPPPPIQTIVKYTRPLSDPPSSALTALLCIRFLFQASFTAEEDKAPRADADHFGFPGVVEDVEEDSNIDMDDEDSERAGAARGRRAFRAVRSLMEGVKIRDEALMSWIHEMVDI